MTLTRSQFIEKATQLSLTIDNPIEAIADLVERNFGRGFQPEPGLPPQPKVVIEFPGDTYFKSRRLLGNGVWQRWEDPRTPHLLPVPGYPNWVDEDPDPIQRKLAELLLDEWDDLTDISDTQLAGERGYEGDV